MAEYFNAKEILPKELLAKIMDYIPHECRAGAVLYFSEDYYQRRNAEIVRYFQECRSNPLFGSHLEIYEALSERFGLTKRRIIEIVKEARRSGERLGPSRRKYSGVRVRRSDRTMRVRQGSQR